MDVLFNDYETILRDLNISSFNLEEDKYSGCSGQLKPDTFLSVFS